MQRISFMLTVPQFRARTKDVTRRDGWTNLKRGDRLLACEKCQGLKRGERMVELGVIEVINPRREPLGAIHSYPANETAREGFPELSTAEFVKMFIESHRGVNRESVLITRIHYRYVLPEAERKFADCFGVIAELCADGLWLPALDQDSARLRKMERKSFLNPFTEEHLAVLS